jgi:hypothetical protein
MLSFVITVCLKLIPIFNVPNAIVLGEEMEEDSFSGV